MNWWQTLLISMIPAIIAAFVSLFQLKRAKEEFKEKYDLDQKYHISQTRFDTEYSIYKELSEKFVTLIRTVSRLFPLDKQFFQYEKFANPQYYQYLYDNISNDFENASKAIYGYAIFIPEDWFNRFDLIISDCYVQTRCFYNYKVNNTSAELDPKLDQECLERTEKINKMFGDLIKELRAHIESLEIKEKKESK